MSKVGRNIKKIRSVKGLSQQAFADLFSLTRGNISSYEELRAEPKIEIIVNIAKYFGIPLNDFILKDLSVNELLHFDTSLVLDMEKLKKKDRFVEIPYVSSVNFNDYISNFLEPEFLETLPKISIPNSSPFNLLAIEVDNSQNFPEGFTYKNGDVLIFESVSKENIHRILGRFGIMVNREGMKMGIFEKKEENMVLALNELVFYSFTLDSDFRYWVLRALYSQEV
ncbi:helix-turn-helix domain-containing protein [Apibacter adventoris]|uniref:helix-turn-helix domain-containing protein n=1 Tax=Apibacter adventoris TaxID=1679466 RepID=UPI000CF64BC9|nr:helix-turn-helix transcriptional regulator [Apibacter adventoris]PQL95005.1 XRE family transcriptional regulator [Apibacter adventoris]